MDIDIGRLRLDTLWLQVESCYTFISVAQIKCELGRERDAQRFLADGERAYSSLLLLFSESHALSPEMKQQLQSEIAELCQRLNEVNQLTLRGK